MIPGLSVRRFATTCLALFALQAGLIQAATVSGEGTKWFPITLDFDGPRASETDDSPNPFLDYRLTVTLTAPSGASIVVPGFFDGDGQGNGTGSVWRARFSANEVGEWRYVANFRRGDNVALSLDANAGSNAMITIDI